MRTEQECSGQSGSWNHTELFKTMWGEHREAQNGSGFLSNATQYLIKPGSELDKDHSFQSLLFGTQTLVDQNLWHGV